MTIYTFQDASTWDVPGDTGFLTFASPEDAKKAEALFRRIQDEAYANGYATALKADITKAVQAYPRLVAELRRIVLQDDHLTESEAHENAHALLRELGEA